MSATYFEKRQAYSRGQADAEREFDDEEDESVSNILCKNAHFQQGVLKAQEKLAQSCGALSLPPEDQSKPLKIRTGLLYLFSKEASATDSHQMREQAKKILSASLFPTAAEFDEEDYLNIARFAVENLDDLFETSYELGHASEFVISLMPDEYEHIGYVSHMNHFIEILENIDLDEIAEKLTATANTKEKYYERYLLAAMEPYVSALTEKVEAVIKSDIPKKTLGFGSPSP